MKKRLKFLLVIILSVFMVNTKVLAASANLSVSSNSVFVGETFTVSVSAKSVAAWNIHTSVSGPVTGCIINEADATSDANDADKTFTASCKATDIGTITITLSGDVTSSSTGNSVDISGTKNVTVRKISTNNNLSSLKVGNVSVPDFSASKLSYTVTVDSESINISAVAEDPNASISGTGNKTLKYGSNKFEIKVTAENGSVKTYTLNVNRKDTRDTDNYLYSLTLDKGNLKFNRNTLNYTVNVKNNVDKIKITAVPESDKAILNGDGEKSLKLGTNRFEINVVAENGEKRTYVLTINREDVRDSNKYLKILSLDNGDIHFDKEKLIYKINVLNSVDKIKITAIPESEKSTVTGDGEKTLKVGKNEFEVVVTAENESKKTYVVVVTRLDKDSELFIKSLTIEGVKLEFNPDVLEYSIFIENQTSLNFKYELVNGVTAVIEGNDNLQNGSVILLKLKKDIGDKEYRFNVKKNISNVVDNKVVESKNKKNNKWLIFAVIGIIALIIIGFFAKKKKDKSKYEKPSTPTPDISSLNKIDNSLVKNNDNNNSQSKEEETEVFERL